MGGRAQFRDLDNNMINNCQISLRVNSQLPHSQTLTLPLIDINEKRAQRRRFDEPFSIFYLMLIFFMQKRSRKICGGATPSLLTGARPLNGHAISWATSGAMHHSEFCNPAIYHPILKIWTHFFRIGLKNKTQRRRFELPRCKAPPALKAGAVGQT